MAEGPLSLYPCSRKEHRLNHVLAGLCSIAPLSLGGQFIPRILPPWPSDCLVLQLSLPCALGDPLAASSREPRPQTPPTLQIETPSPNECSPAALAACTLHMLVSSTAPMAHARPSSDPFPRIAGRCLQCSQRPSLAARLERGAASPPSSWLQLRPETHAEKGPSFRAGSPLPRAGS